MKIYEKKKGIFLRNEEGFSLLELVVAVGILLVLSVVGFVSYQGITDNARQAAVQKAASEVHVAATAYEAAGKDPQLAVDEWNESQGLSSSGGYFAPLAVVGLFQQGTPGAEEGVAVRLVSTSPIAIEAQSVVNGEAGKNIATAPEDYPVAVETPEEETDGNWCSAYWDWSEVRADAETHLRFVLDYDQISYNYYNSLYLDLDHELRIEGYDGQALIDATNARFEAETGLVMDELHASAAAYPFDTWEETADATAWKDRHELSLPLTSPNVGVQLAKDMTFGNEDYKNLLYNSNPSEYDQSDLDAIYSDIMSNFDSVCALPEPSPKSTVM